MGKNGYLVYLGKCLLPVTPEKIEMKINNANTTVTLIDDGEINILKQAKLTDVEFECLIPQTRQPYAMYSGGFVGAGYFLDYFESLKQGKKAVQFIVVRYSPGGRAFFNTNLTVSLEEYSIVEDVKEGFDLKIKIKLKQWKAYGTKKITIRDTGNSVVASAASDRETNNAPETPDSYVVRKGDCLWTIAKSFYGNGADYGKIYDANKDIVGGNPNLIYPGQELTIPKKGG